MVVFLPRWCSYPVVFLPSGVLTRWCSYPVVFLPSGVLTQVVFLPVPVGCSYPGGVLNPGGVLTSCWLPGLCVRTAQYVAWPGRGGRWRKRPPLPRANRFRRVWRGTAILAGGYRTLPSCASRRRLRGRQYPPIQSGGGGWPKTQKADRVDEAGLRTDSHIIRPNATSRASLSGVNATHSTSRSSSSSSK